MRATPKTSSPVSHCQSHISAVEPASRHCTFADLRTKLNVLLRTALDLLLGCHNCGIVVEVLIEMITVWSSAVQSRKLCVGGSSSAKFRAKADLAQVKARSNSRRFNFCLPFPSQHHIINFAGTPIILAARPRAIIARYEIPNFL